MVNEPRRMVEDRTTPHDEYTIELIQKAVSAVQQLMDKDSIVFAALLGSALGSMLAYADKGSEDRMNLSEEHHEALKRTFNVNFDASYNHARSELDLQTTIQPKKGPI